MRIELYSETGFDVVNIPDSIDTLRGEFSPVRTYNDINIVQTEYLATIIVDQMTHKIARGVDYAIVMDSSSDDHPWCYTVDSFEMQGGNICKFNLVLDAYNSMGGLMEDSGNELIAASAERMHVSVEDDNTNWYSQAEPFSPSQWPDLQIGTSFPLSGNNTQLLETTAIPPRLIKSQRGFSGGKGQVPIYNENINLATPSNAIKVSGSSTKNGRGGKTINNYNATAGTYANIAYANTKTGSDFNVTSISEDGSEIETMSYSQLAMLNPDFRVLNSTVYNIAGIAGAEQHPIKVGTRWFNRDNITATFKDNDGTTITTNLMKMLVDLGRQDALTNLWTIPNEYIAATSQTAFQVDNDNDCGISSITSIGLAYNVTWTPTYTANNKKCYYGQSAIIKMFNPASGEEMDKEISEVCNNQTPVGPFLLNGYIGADLRPSGTPIFGWYTKDGVSFQTLGILQSMIKGQSWANYRESINGTNQIELQKNKQLLELKYDINNQQGINNVANILGKIDFKAIGTSATGGAAIGSIIPGVGSAAGALTFGAIEAGKQLLPQALNIYNAGASYLNTKKRIDALMNTLDRQAGAATVSLGTIDNNFCRDTGKNTFYYLISNYCAEDMKSYDTFLTRFGYNVGNKSIQQSDLKNRPDFNFIKLNDATIIAESAGKELVDKAIEQLKQGVRLWHVAPNEHSMSAEGNR